MSFSLDQLLTSKKRAACALLGPTTAYIDHTAPLCAMLGIPLLMDQPYVKILFESYYPDLQCQLRSWTVETLVRDYSTVLYPFRPEPSFRTVILQKQAEEPHNSLWFNETEFIYHLHGCSDKGYHSNWITPSSHFLDVDQILFYGARMIDIFKDNGVLDKLRGYSLVGNYRRIYYERHREHFKKLAKVLVFRHFEKEQPTLIYAPSWNDPEGSCSFFNCYESVLNNLPAHFNLIVKLHPYLLLKTDDYDPTPLKTLLKQYEERGNIQMVQDLPFVYPLLEQCVGYIGDFSSISYDALSYSLPLFFLNHLKRDVQDSGAHILRCGTNIDPSELNQLYPKIEAALDGHAYQRVQEETYTYAFGKDLSYDACVQNLKGIFKL